MKFLLCRDNHLEEGPEDATPIKLAPFVDGWVHRFTYVGDLSPGAVYRCQSNVTAWGIEWKKETDERIRVVPRLVSDKRVNVSTGLDVLEMQGLDDKSVLLVIEENIAKSERSNIYGIILDYSKMDLELCKTCVDNGFLHCKNNIPKWTPRQMKTQWDLIEEARQDATPSQAPATATTPSPSPKKKSRKRKTLAGAPGDEEKDKSKKLTIARCVQMNELEVKKLLPKEIKAMKALYKSTFDPLYKWGKKPFEAADGKPLRVHFDYLHKAPVARLVYREIQPQRLKGVINKARLETDYHCESRCITVLPIKLGPYGADGVATYYETCPDKKFIRKDTHYYIIGGMHTVEAYRILVAEEEIPECDREEASTFDIIPIFAPPSKFTDVIQLSRALNQNVAGEQKEQSFTKQLVNARIKWRDMGSPQPSFLGRSHSPEYLVRLAICMQCRSHLGISRCIPRTLLCAPKLTIFAQLIDPDVGSSCFG